MERVIRVMARLNEPQRAAIQRCVELMCSGMPRFQFTASLKGLARSSDLDDYCYYVAGVVGEMLTELFLRLFARNRPPPARLVRPCRILCAGTADDEYPQGRVGGPQPRRLLAAAGCIYPPRSRSRAMCRASPTTRASAPGFANFVGVAHAHLRNALDYTLLIPGKETGIRRFCLWAIGLAVLTLRKIEHNPRFTAGAQVKVTRSAVAMTRLLTDVGGAQRLDAAAPVRAGGARPAARAPRRLAAGRAVPASSKGRRVRRSASCGAPTGIQGREPHRTEAGTLPGTAIGRARRHRVAHAAARDGLRLWIAPSRRPATR